MTAYNTGLYNAQNDGYTSADTFVAGKDLQGKVRALVASTASSVAWAQNDTINIGVLPAGARVLQVNVYQSAAAGSSVTLAVTGNDGSARTFVTAYDNNSAVNAVKPSEYQAELAVATTLVATLAAANPTDNVVYTFAVLYTSYNS